MRLVEAGTERRPPWEILEEEMKGYNWQKGEVRSRRKTPRILPKLPSHLNVHPHPPSYSPVPGTPGITEFG